MIDTSEKFKDLKKNYNTHNGMNIGNTLMEIVIKLYRLIFFVLCSNIK